MQSDDSGAVKAFWDKRAKAPVGDAEVTHRDVWQRWLEIETLKRHLRPTDRVLDVGCGTGHTTRAVAPFVSEIVGVDYSSEMIERARASAPREGSKAPEFATCDVRELGPERFGAFDVVISERCLINLASWDAQRAALDRIRSVVRPGGRFLFVEGSATGRAALNVFRQRAGLAPMPPVWHNVDFDKEALLAHLCPDYTLEHDLHFGVYDFVARIVHPLFVAPAEPTYEGRLNEIAAKLALESQEFPELSRVLFLVLRRRTSA